MNRTGLVERGRARRQAHLHSIFGMLGRHKALFTEREVDAMLKYSMSKLTDAELDELVHNSIAPEMLSSHAIGRRR